MAATVRITAVKGISYGENGHVAQAPRLGAPQALAVTSVAQTSAVVNASMVMLYAQSANAYYSFGTVTTTQHFIGSGERIIIDCEPTTVIQVKDTS